MSLRTKIKQHRLTTLLVILIIYIFTISYTNIYSGLLSPLLFLLLLIALLQAVELSKRHYRLLIAVAIMALILHLGGIILSRTGFVRGDLPGVVLAGTVLYTLFVALTIAGLLSEVFRAKVITLDVIRGSIAIYLLLGVFFALLYAIVFFSEPSQFSESIYPGRLSEFIYFSFTTLTTLGYGDISPAGTLVRTLSTIEAVSGQLFLTITIARLVGLHLVHSSQTSEPPK
jgi:hypothetical protein